MSGCIFCSIVSGKIPATKVYEDDEVLVFMDIGPLVKGHVLVIPKVHIETVFDASDELIGKLHQIAARVARAQKSQLGALGVNVLQNNGHIAGQEVDHFHIHVIPRFEGDGHTWKWTPLKYSEVVEMEDIANKISAGI